MFSVVVISCRVAVVESICSERRLELFGVWLWYLTSFGLGVSWWWLFEPLASFYSMLKPCNYLGIIVDEVEERETIRKCLPSFN